MSEEYELEVLLGLRREERQEAERRYAEALGAYHEAGRRVEEARQSLREREEERRQRCQRFDEEVSAGSARLADLRGFERFLEGLKEAEAVARSALEEAGERETRARAAMREAHEGMIATIRALEAVEQHRLSWEEERRGEERRKQSVAEDEIAARIWSESP